MKTREKSNSDCFDSTCCIRMLLFDLKALTANFTTGFTATSAELNSRRIGTFSIEILVEVASVLSKHPTERLKPIRNTTSEEELRSWTICTKSEGSLTPYSAI